MSVVLPQPDGADEGKAHAGLGIDADILQQFAVGHVAKVHMLKGDLALRAASSTASAASGSCSRASSSANMRRAEAYAVWMRVMTLVTSLNGFGVLVGIGQEDLHAAHRNAAGTPLSRHAADHSDHGIDDIIDKTRTGVGGEPINCARSPAV